jgi:integrase
MPSAVGQTLAWCSLPGSARRSSHATSPTNFDRRIGKAGVRRITVHGTRKSCGSLLAALDVHPRVAMQILRHSRIAITMEIYTEVVSSPTREALRKLGDQLGPWGDCCTLLLHQHAKRPVP